MWETLKVSTPDSRLASQLAESAGCASHEKRITDYYLPVYQWIRSQLGKAPLVVGINGPQGGGKTTLTSALREVFAKNGVKTVSLSIDDFYLPRVEQVELARGTFPNPYLQARGYPGTHDVPLGIETIQALKRGAGKVELPSYDKAAHQGKGDRKPRNEWISVETPVDLVLFEGWMLGFRPAGGTLPKDLARIDVELSGYRAWNNLLDSFIWLEPDDHRHVLRWRVEAEEKMRARVGAGMSNEEALAYITTFLPAYETYLPGMKLQPPISGRALRVRIGSDRSRT